MKTFSIIIIGLLIGANLSFGQGTVIFANSPISRVYTNSYSGGPASGLTSTNENSYYYALFIAPTTVTNVSGTAFSDINWTFTGNYATNNINRAGLFHGGYNSDGTVTVPGYETGSPANFLVVGWSANIGATVTALINWYNNPIMNGWLGQSVISFNQYLGGGIQPAPSIFAQVGSTNLGEIDGFTFNAILVPTPEPSAIALFALSGGWLMLRARRRK